MLQIGFTYIGTVVGAGFASGQEIFQFITRFGDKSLFIIAICTVLFIAAGNKIMLISAQINAPSYHQFNNHMFGHTIGRWINWATLAMLICITGVMLAGTGALFEQQFGGYYQAGIFCTMLLIYVVTLRGMEAIIAVNSVVVPLMIAFNLLIAIKTFTIHGIASAPSLPAAGGWLYSPFLYVSFNVILGLAVLVPLGNEIRDKYSIIGGGIIGGLGLGLLLFLSNYALSAHFEQIRGAEIPMAQIVSMFSPVVHWLFSLIILGEIFTTLVGNVFGLTRQLELFLPPSFQKQFIILSLLLVCYVISQFGFSTLVHHLYPLFGYISAGTLILIFSKKKRQPSLF